LAKANLPTSFKGFGCELNRKKSKFECYGLLASSIRGLYLEIARERLIRGGDSHGAFGQLDVAVGAPPIVYGAGRKNNQFFVDRYDHSERFESCSRFWLTRLFRPV
jgi:hypothetical protein